MRGRSKPASNQLTIDFGPFCQPRQVPSGSLFQRVRSQMLKRKQRTALRRKPLQYQKLQISLQDKLKKKTFNREQQRDQLVMLQKCKNYFQLRRPQEGLLTPKNNRRGESRLRPQTSCGSLHGAGFMNQLRGVMEDCGAEERDLKENMHLFTFYCRAMDRRLEGIRNNIEKKERMV